MNRRIDIEILRVFGVILVILFHTVGRWNDSDIVAELPDLFQSWVRIGVWIAVPMFLFVSGFLFYGQIRKRKYQSYKQCLKEKALHLLIPYVCFTTFIMLASGCFDWQEIMGGGFWHLWFLPALFCCFMLYYPLLDHISRSGKKKALETILLATSLALLFVRIPDRFCWFGIDGALKWGFYFVLGAVVGSHETKFRTVMGRYRIWLPLGLIWLANNLLTTTNYMTVTWHNTLAVGAALLVIFYFVGKIKSLPERMGKFILIFSAASMGIYILHYWILIYATSSTAFSILGGVTYANVYNGILIVFAITLIVVALSFVISRACGSNRVLKYMIG